MPAVFIKGAIVVVSVVGAAAIAISQIPEVRAFGEDCRRKIAVALHNLGDEINPNRSQPRFNRPEDAEGFMQPHAAAGEMDADDESRRRQREELMYWNAIKLENMQKQKAKETESRGPTFDDILRNNNSTSHDETYATKTGAEVLGDEGTLRRRGEGSRGMDRASLYANPFADENYLDSEGDAKMIAPEADEMEDIYTDDDLRDIKKPVPDQRVLAAAGDYPLGQHYTMQLKNTNFGDKGSTEDLASEHPVSADQAFPQNPDNHFEQSSPKQPENSHTLQDYQSQLDLLEQQSNKRTCMPRREIDTTTKSATTYSKPAGNHTLQDYQMELILLEQQNKKRRMLAHQEIEPSEMAASTSTPTQPDHATGNSNALDYQMQLMLLEQQNKKRRLMARQETENSEKSAASSSASPIQSRDHAERQEYQKQLMLLEAQNKKRLEMARQETEKSEWSAASSFTSPVQSMTRQETISTSKYQPGSTSTSAADSYSTADISAALSHKENERLVDVSQPVQSSTPGVWRNPTQPQESNYAFASIHAWNDSSNASFYSPLPGTPRAISSAGSEHIGGDITPIDSISLAGSGEDVANDNASSVGGGRYDDVMSLDGGISTPGSWTEVGSVVSEDDR